MNSFITQPQNASWIELSSAAFKNNVSVYKKLIGQKVLLGCVLKGNAYGHGFREMLSLVYENTIDVIFVISPFDAFFIREFEIKFQKTKKRIVVIGALVPDEVCECAKKDIEVAFGDEHFKEYNYFTHLKKQRENQRENQRQNQKEDKPLKIHIHVDTGLGREGVRLENLETVLALLKENSDCTFVQGIMSHFANVEDVTEQTYAKFQLDTLNTAYNKIVQSLELKHKPEKHISQSAATLIMPRNGCDIVRAGIGLYGYWPSHETKISARVLHPKLPNLTPVLQWKVKSQSVKDLPTGSYIGYGCSYRTERAVRVAVLPVGYYDGYPRSLSNLGHVLVNGKRCKILGRVMMNYCTVDVTEATHNTDSVLATLIGQNGEESISAEMMAEWADTIQYEIITRIGAHLKRVVL